MHYLRWRQHGDPLVVRVTRSRRRWTERDLFLLEDLLERGLSDAVIARRLGCSTNAVRLARKRHGVRSRSELLLSGRMVADRLGLGCVKTVSRWITEGWLIARKGPRRGRHRQWQITELSLWAFMQQPEHWHRWNPAHIPDPDLRAWAFEIRAGERFLTLSEVAERFYVQPGTVAAWISKGLLPSVRHGNRMVRERDLAGFTPPGQLSRTGRVRRTWFPDDDRQLIELRAQGCGWREIGHAMGRSQRACATRWYRLQQGNIATEPVVVVPGDPTTVRHEDASRICRVAGCGRPRRKLGLCGMHYACWWRHGDVDTVLERGTGDVCGRGHPRTPANVWVSPNTGKTQCRLCKQERRRFASS